MPIKSYIVHPIKGQKEALLIALRNLTQCEVIPAENQNVLALVTDTSNQKEEELLIEQIDTISSLQSLSLVSGFNTTHN